MYAPIDCQPGDVILVRGRGPLSVGIKWSTSSVYSHAAMVGQGRLVEAVWRVSEAPVDKYVAVGDRFGVQASEAQRAYAVAWMEKHLGRPYGTREILLDLDRYDLHWLARVRHPLNRWTCSGLIVEAYRQAGVALTYAPYPSPADLFYSPVLVGDRSQGS